jgi:Flp pilus assembly protein TadD
MRQPVTFALCVAGIVLLSACANDQSKEAAKALKDLNVIDESNLNDLMLEAGDPGEAVAYFAKASSDNPDRADLKRGLALSLMKAQKPAEAVKVWRELIGSGQGTNEDRVLLADALIRNNDWKGAETELNQIPPTHETYERYRLEAMVADANKKWDKADSFYETAFGLTTRPSGILNNWGYSKLTRGDFAGAEKLFMQALTYDPNVFTTKNNLVLSRAGQRKYDLPIVQMTQTERAELLYTAALSAIKQGDIETGRTMLHEAVETHPQYFEEAARALETLESGATNG